MGSPKTKVEQIISWY